MRNMFLTTVVGKVTLRRGPDGYKLADFRRDLKTFRHIRQREVECKTQDYDTAKQLAYVWYENLLAETIEYVHQQMGD